MLSTLFTGCTSSQVVLSEIGMGWSSNTVNTVIFREQAVTSANGYQFTGYYDPDGSLVLARRKLDATAWRTHTQYTGDVKDAHNSISMAIDDKGYLHVSWGQHNTRLRYARSTKPYGLELSDELPMTGMQESSVTYPEFHKLPNGKLIFCYRSGESGRGNMVMNEYNITTKTWKQIQNNLLDGEEQRSAYWQLAVSREGIIHLSWVWRENWDVATNHDLCYAVSYDGGYSWEKSDRTKYTLPITQEKAEIAWKIPQNSNLINQTSMTLNPDGNPYIATYWNTNGIVQYKIVYYENGQWSLKTTQFLNKPFHLAGGGTKQIPISRPEILVSENHMYLLFRSEERRNAITLAYAKKRTNHWKLIDLVPDVGQWEPNYDRYLWNTKKELHIFTQKVHQIDNEGLSKSTPEPVRILTLKKLPEF